MSRSHTRNATTKVHGLEQEPSLCLRKIKVIFLCPVASSFNTMAPHLRVNVRTILVVVVLLGIFTAANVLASMLYVHAVIKAISESHHPVAADVSSSVPVRLFSGHGNSEAASVKERSSQTLTMSNQVQNGTQRGGSLKKNLQTPQHADRLGESAAAPSTLARLEGNLTMAEREKPRPAHFVLKKPLKLGFASSVVATQLSSGRQLISGTFQDGPRAKQSSKKTPPMTGSALRQDGSRNVQKKPKTSQTSKPKRAPFVLKNRPTSHAKNPSGTKAPKALKNPPTSHAKKPSGPKVPVVQKKPPTSHAKKPSTAAAKGTLKPSSHTQNVTSGTARPLECRNCFRHEYKYVIQNESICRHNKSDVIHLLLLITTVHRNAKARQALRDTWLSVARGNRGNVRYVFLLGENFNSTTRKELLVENRKYGDLIMEDFKDAYLNLTLKTLMGFKWASTFCPQARFVMKTDDDMWVNIKSVLRLLKVHEKRLQTNMGGHCSSRSKPIRKKNSKWYASEQSFPQDSYGGFCSGTGYVTSMNVVKKVYTLSPSVPFFHLEDVYVGLCLRKLGFGLVTLPGFHRGGTPHKACHMQSAAIVTSHRVMPETLVEMWNGKCAKSTI